MSLDRTSDTPTNVLGLHANRPNYFGESLVGHTHQRLGNYCVLIVLRVGDVRAVLPRLHRTLPRSVAQRLSIVVSVIVFLFVVVDAVVRVHERNIVVTSLICI